MVFPATVAGVGAAAGYAIGNKLSQNKTDKVAGEFAEKTRYSTFMISLAKNYLNDCREAGNLAKQGGTAREARAKHFVDLLDNRSDFSKIFDWRGDYEKSAKSVKFDVDSRIMELGLEGKSTKVLREFSDELGSAISAGRSENSGRVEKQAQKVDASQAPKKSVYADESMVFRLLLQAKDEKNPAAKKARVGFADAIQKYIEVKDGNGVDFDTKGKRTLNPELDKAILAELNTLKAAGRGETSEAMALKELREAVRILKSKLSGEIAVV
jgi:hypothetical protein